MEKLAGLSVDVRADAVSLKAFDPDNKTKAWIFDRSMLLCYCEVIYSSGIVDRLPSGPRWKT